MHGEYGHLPRLAGASGRRVGPPQRRRARRANSSRIPGQPNYVYVVLRNRGTEPALAASVDVFATVAMLPTFGIPLAGGWQPLQGSNTTQRLCARETR